MANLRIGNGFDVHQFVTGRDLVLGGKKIEFRFGLQGHSDADVLIHAVIDSLLGAAGLMDIGRMFPDTDRSYKDISSMVLLGKVRESLEAISADIVNIDAIVICQEPKISPHIDEMRNNISAELHIESTRVNIKGKTTEGLGFTGRGEGIACYSVALLQMRGL
ncbi:MAG TPA: 2-C-methyl-D-erythritol 2,4-cyclodiphosphate synthase [Spirochaetota bacterium]|nr:2-C-methyl-D-erythritol 2,4-cyclodiphosphate synthase [Spirochaetota bacterium]